LNGEHKINTAQDEQRREFVLDFIKQKELIKSQDNLIHSEKVFVVSAVLKWCYEKAHKKKMTPALWEKYKRLISQYIAGVVDIKWTQNNFEVIEVINDEPKPRRSRRRRKQK